MAGVKKKPTKGGMYQAWFTDYTGQRRYFTATTRTEAKREAKRLEAEHRLVRLGIRPAPSSADKHARRPFEEVMQEYLAWGEAQGGRGGRAWGKTHARMRRAHLAWWQDRLGLKFQADLHRILPRVEKELQSLQQRGRAGKTMANYAEAIGAFCDWCVQRGYLAEDPLKDMVPFDATPRTHRRAMTADEIARLLEACPPHRRLLYETAFATGLRANELRSLRVEHLDVEHGGLHLDAAWTKNRKAGVQPVPEGLVARLAASADSGEASRLYQRFSRKKATSQAPVDPLLYVPSHTARALDKDLKAAGIPKQSPGGKIDFHACRVAYINLVIQSGVTVKEAQELARHASPELTMNTYGRVQKERLAKAVEHVGHAILQPKRVPVEYRRVVGAEHESATHVNTMGCADEKWWRRRELNLNPTQLPEKQNLHKTAQNPDRSVR